MARNHDALRLAHEILDVLGRADDWDAASEELVRVLRQDQGRTLRLVGGHRAAGGELLFTHETLAANQIWVFPKD